jgi:hypothetical protein
MPGGGKGGGKGLSTTVNVDSDADVTLDIVGLDDIDVDLSASLAVPQPIQTKSDLAATTRSELAVTQPIVTDLNLNASATVDVKPVDLCLTFGIGRLPRARICRPVERHLGMTLFGIEIFGLNWSGYSELVFSDLDPRPHVELGGPAGVQARPGARRKRPRIVGQPGGSGLRLRLGD